VKEGPEKEIVNGKSGQTTDQVGKKIHQVGRTIDEKILLENLDQPAIRGNDQQSEEGPC
jgi:hypothetical protein